MQLSYELTLAEFKSALNLHARQKLSRRIHTCIYKFILPVLAVLLSVLTLYAHFGGASDVTGSLVFYDAVVVSIVVLVFVLRFVRICSAFRALYPAGAKNRVTSMVISDEYILTSVEGVGQGRYLWTGISAYVQNKQVCLFYIGDERFLIIPLRILPAVQRDELNELFACHLTKKQLPC